MVLSSTPPVAVLYAANASLAIRTRVVPNHYISVLGLVELAEILTGVDNPGGCRKDRRRAV